MALDDFIKDIKKSFSKVNEDIIYDKSTNIDFIKTGCLPFDLFVGGFPKGRISEIFGAEHSGKSSLLYSTAAEIQKKKGTCIYLDFEYSFNKEFAKKAFNLEVDNKTFILLQPNTAEEGGMILDSIMEKIDTVDAVFIDSIAAIQSQASIESSLEDSQRVGEHARTIGRLLHKLRSISSLKNCAVVLVNQVRAALNINPYAAKSGLGNMDSSDETTTGGKSIRFYASLRIKLSNTPIKKDIINPITGQLAKNIVIGNITKFKVIKNKVGRPFCEFLAHFNIEIDGAKPGWCELKDIMWYLKSHSIIEQRAAKFIYHGSKPEYHFTNSEGKDKAEIIFLSKPELVEDAKNQLLVICKNTKASNIVLDSSNLNEDDEEFEDDESSSNEISL